MIARVMVFAGLLGALTATAARAQSRTAFVVDKKLAEAGEKLFAAKACGGCHTIGKGALVGPDLAGLMERRTAAWVRQWLHDPPAMVATDATAKALKEQFKIQMPNLGLTDAEIAALSNYLAAKSKQPQKD